METYQYVDRVPQPIRDRIAARLEESHREWEEGRSASPCELDYVIYADRILEERYPEYGGSVPEGREFVADCLSEKWSDGRSLTTWPEITDYIVDQLVAE